MILKMLGDNVCERQVFPYRNPFTDMVKQQESFKLELHSKNYEVVVIISHDLEGVETFQAGQSEPVNTI